MSQSLQLAAGVVCQEGGFLVAPPGFFEIIAEDHLRHLSLPLALQRIRPPVLRVGCTSILLFYGMTNGMIDGNI